MKKLQHYTLYMLVAFTVFITARYTHLYQGHKEICETLDSKFVEVLSVQDKKNCYDVFSKSFTFKGWEKDMNSWLGQWGWSHLMVYAPFKTNEIWESKTKSIGVKLKILKGEYVAVRVHKDSLFQRGDVFKSVNDKTNLNTSLILYEGGHYTVERSKKLILIKARPKDFVWNDAVVIEGSYFKVPSFRGEFFLDENMNSFIKKLKAYNSDVLYLDLRGNYGGNIASGLLFLSFFLCDEPVVGQFHVPKNKGKGKAFYPHTVDQNTQIRVVNSSEFIDLKVPKSKFCYKRPVKVLVDSITASTAELVALALREQKQSSLVGVLTSGQMVLSSWEAVRNFPQGFSYSFPYATYLSAKGKEIETFGVLPDVEKNYDFELERKGLDSFIY